MTRNPPIDSKTLAVSRRAFGVLLGALTAGALSGCSLLQAHADPTRFYVLTTSNALSQSPAAGGFARLKIGLRTIEMPAYLRTKLMVVRTGSNQMDFAEYDRWAEPLDEGIGRVMKDALGSAGNVESVDLISHGGETLDYEIRVRVLACEGVRAESGAGSMRMGVSWEIQPVRSGGGMIKQGGFTSAPAAWDGRNYGELALELSKAITAAGRALAADLPADARQTGASDTKQGK